MRPGPHVDVVGAERDPGELGVTVGVFQREPSPGQHGRAVRALGRRAGRGARQAGGVQAARRRPGSLPARTRAGRRAGLVADQRGGEPVRLGGVGERPPALVAVPFLVDLGIVGQPAGA